MAALEEENKELKEQLRDKSQRSRAGFMDWLEIEVSKIQEQKTKKDSELNLLCLAKADLMKKSSLEDLEKTANEFISKFHCLTGIQQRSFIERMIAKIVIKKDNKLELHVNWDPQKKTSERPRRCNGSVTGTTKSSIRSENGGREQYEDQVFFSYTMVFQLLNSKQI